MPEVKISSISGLSTNSSTLNRGVIIQTLNSWTRVVTIMNINYWNHIESMEPNKYSQKTSCHFLTSLTLGQSWRSPKVILCGRRNTFATFSQRSTLDVSCCVFIHTPHYLTVHTPHLTPRWNTPDSTLHTPPTTLTSSTLVGNCRKVFWHVCH